MALCIVGINIIAIGDQHSNLIFSPAEASTSSTSDTVSVSIPSQILHAKIPKAKAHPHNQQNQQLWLYEGALYDPLDGRQVAKVQGLELVQQLDDTSHLAIDALLKHPNATYQDSKTVWSQKIFCYTTTKDVGKDASSSTTSSSNDTVNRIPPKRSTMQESILDSVRVRPRSPRKEVPLDQAVAVYETATTFLSRKKRGNTNAKSNKHQSDDDDDDEVLVHSEWPNGQTIWGKAQECSRQIAKSERKNDNSGSHTIDFTIFAKLRNKNSPLYSPDLIRDENEQDETRTTRNGDIIVSPKRVSLVQFGSSDGTMESKHKFGARETYSYRNIPKTVETIGKSPKLPKWFPIPWKKNKVTDSSLTSPTVYYTRYGEGPPFYAPGRMCMLELRGRPISNFGEVGPLLKGLIQGKSSGKQQKRKPTISNFNWQENESQDQDFSTLKDRKASRNGTEGFKIHGNNKLSTTSIQTAWNLRERNQELGIYGSATFAKSKQISKRRRPTRQPLTLRMDIPDETMANTGGKRNLRALLRKGMHFAGTVWDRIKDSSTMESRS